MEDHCSPLTWSYFFHDEGIEELKHYLLYTTELEAAILSAKEEITKREFEILNLKDLLGRSIKERNEAQAQCQKLMVDKLFLQQQLLQNQQEKQQQQLETKQPVKPDSAGTYTSSEDETKAIPDSNNHINSPDSTKTKIPASNFSDPAQHKQQPLQSELPEVILKLAADRPLPEKGKLLQAVKDAGPLLQTLLLAGPLPQWQHPPPQLDSIEIPPVTISSPTARLVHQESFKKRGLELPESLDLSSSPGTKYQKVTLH